MPQPRPLRPLEVRAASPDRPTRDDDVEVVRFATCNADAGELILGVLVSLFPFYWMVVMAANATADILKYSVGARRRCRLLGFCSAIRC